MSQEVVADDDFSVAVFEVILQRGALNVAEIAECLGAETSAVERMIHAMVTTGLLRTSPEQPGKYRVARNPIEFARAVDFATERFKSDYARLADAAGLLLRDGQFLRGHGEANQIRVERLDLGDSALVEISQFCAQASARVASLVPSLPSSQVLAAAVIDDMAALRRGIAVAHVYPPEAQTAPHVTDYLRLVSPLGAAVRTNSQIPVHLVLIDHDLAITTSTSHRDHEIEALIIREATLIRALDHLFTLVWQQASPLSDATRAAEPLTAKELVVLEYLGKGVSSALIAERLGVTERTVLRRVERLCAITGATSRFELGMEAVRRGWLE